MKLEYYSQFLLFFIIPIGFLIVLVYTYSFHEYSVLIFYFFCFTISILFIYVSNLGDIEDFQFLTKLFFLSYSFNIIIIFLFLISFYEQSGTPFLQIRGLKIPDDQGYYYSSINIVYRWLNDKSADSIIYMYSYHGYLYFLSCIYYISYFIGDFSTITPRIVNATVGALIPIVVYMLTKIIFDRVFAKRAAILCTVFPIFTYYSVIILRDIIVAFLLIYSVYLFIKYYEANVIIIKFFYLIILALSLLFLYAFRNPTAYVLIFSFLLFLYIMKGKFYKLIIITSFLGFIVLFILKFDISSIGIQKYLMLWETLNDVFYRTESYTSLGMRYIINAPFPLNVILRLPYTIIFPFPPFTELTFPMLIRGLGVIQWYFLIPFWMHGMWKHRKNPYSNLLILIIMIIVIGISLTTVDTRHKTQFLAFAIIHATSDWSTSMYNKTVISYSLITIILLFIIYIMFKIFNLNLI